MKKILIVESDADLARNLGFHLEQKKYQVQICSDGDEAFNSAASFLPNLVISAINLPGRDGLTLCRQFQETGRAVPVPFIFLTSSSEFYDLKRAEEYGANAFLTKPVTIKKLLAEINKLIGISVELNLRIIIYTEHPNEHNELRDLLFREGYEVFLSKVSRKGMIFQDGKPDLIIADEKNDPAILEKILAKTGEAVRSGDIPVVLSGGVRDYASFRKAISSGAVDYFTGKDDQAIISKGFRNVIERSRFRNVIGNPSFTPRKDDPEEYVKSVNTLREVSRREQKVILIIEDDSAQTDTLRLHLEMNSFSVVISQSGERGIQAASEYLPDLIISDIMLPGISGYEVKEFLNNSFVTRHIPFIYLSAKTNFEDIRKGMNLCADDYIVKPVSMKELMKAIRRYLPETADPSQKNISDSANLESSFEARMEKQIREAGGKKKFAARFKKTSEDADKPVIQNQPQEKKPAEIQDEDVYRVLKPFSEKQKPSDEYLCFSYGSGLLIKVNIACGVEKETPNFNAFLRMVSKKPVSAYIVDLKASEFMDATFLGVIVAFEKKVRLHGGKLKIVVNREQAMGNIVFIHGITRLMEVHYSLVDAIKSA